MASIKFKGIDEYVAKLERLNGHATGEIKAAVYEGTKVVRDAMFPVISTIPIDDSYVKKGEMRQGITSVEMDGLLSGFGISKMRMNGNAITTKIGWSGRNADGTANATVARQVESGTTWMRKNPVFRRAVNSAKSAAEAAIKKKLEAEIEKSMNGG